jgi:hypothetical protein
MNNTRTIATINKELSRTRKNLKILTRVFISGRDSRVDKECIADTALKIAALEIESEAAQIALLASTQPNA